MGSAVVGFDGSPGAERAIAAAGRLLAPAPLVIVTAQRHGLPGTGAQRRAEAESINAHGVELGRQHGAATGMVVTGRNPATGMLEAAHEVGARVIVVGFRGHSTARSMLLGSCSYSLAHRADLPTLVVPDRYPLQGGDGDVGAALVCVDEQDPEPSHLGHALELVRPSAAIVMHVGEGRMTADHILDDHGRPLSYEEIRTQVASLNEGAREHADEVARCAADWLAAHTSKQLQAQGAVSAGSAWQGLVERADADDVELILIGSRSLGALDRTTLGSVSNAVVHHARKPVLIARASTTADTT
jgi:nucleotide-binding universal stress UspA family protein